jgi:hypothetical protein
MACDLSGYSHTNLKSIVMKKNLAIICSMLFLFSCSKYPDGPSISIYSKKARLANTWIINTAYENGVEKTADFNTVFAGYTLTIKKDETYSLSYSPFSVGNYSESGVWDFNDDKTQVTFHKNGSSDQQTWTIKKLESKELWGEYTDSSTVYEVHLVPKQ